MTVYFDGFEKGHYMYTVEISFANDKFSLFPMAYFEQIAFSGYLLRIGFLTFMIEFKKLRIFPKGTLEKIMNGIINA